VASYVALVFAAASFGYTLLKDPEPRISGYREAAHYVCSMAAPDSVVLFSGLRDGSFVFNVKSQPECKNLTVIRADKLLLRVAVHRQLFGVQELGVTDDKLRDMFGRYGIRYIVLEPTFWNDLQSMQMLVRVLHQDQFKLLTTIPVSSNHDRGERQLEIYENLGPVVREKSILKVELPVSGISVEGKVGQGEDR
jgi:hypothetical protein